MIAHYAVHLREHEANVLAAVTNVGVADTDIWREVMSVREGTLSRMNTVAESAAVPAALCVNDGWESGTYWGTVGKLESVQLNLARQETERLIAICHALIGV